MNIEQGILNNEVGCYIPSTFKIPCSIFIIKKAALHSKSRFFNLFENYLGPS